MVSIPAGSYVELSFHVGWALSLDGSLSVVLGQFLERLIDVFSHQRTLLHPTIGAIGNAHVDEAAVRRAFENIEALAIFNGRHFVVDSGYAVAQKCLGRGDVGSFVGFTAVVLAGSGAECERESCDSAELGERT